MMTRKKQVLDEVLSDELKAIHEYVKDIPIVKELLHQVKAKVNEANDRLAVVENVIREHKSDIRNLKRKAA